MALIVAKEDLFQEGRSLGFQHLPRERWPSSLGRTVWQGERLFQESDLSIPPASKGKAAATTLPPLPPPSHRPDTQGACWKQNFWSQQLPSVQCALRPLSFARAQLRSGLSLEKPLPGKSGLSPKSPKRRVLWGHGCSTCTRDTSCLPEHLGRKAMISGEHIFRT